VRQNGRKRNSEHKKKTFLEKVKGFKIWNLRRWNHEAFQIWKFQDLWVPSKRRQQLFERHDVTSQKIDVFCHPAVRTRYVAASEFIRAYISVRLLSVRTGIHMYCMYVRTVPEFIRAYVSVRLPPVRTGIHVYCMYACTVLESGSNHG
jgi:hypothetical protein